MAKHVPHLYLPGPWDGSRILLGDDHRHHLDTVLRRAEGSGLTYTDGRGTIGTGTLETGAVERGAEQVVEVPRPLAIAVAPPKSADRARWVVEKLQEFEVDALIWLRTENGQARPPKPDKSSKWAIGALEQSRGAQLMRIEEAGGFDSLLRPLVVADQAGVRKAAAVKGDGPICIAIGPEGGWKPGEIPHDAPVISLAETVLRVETAAIAAAVVVRTISRSGSGD